MKYPYSMSSAVGYSIVLLVSLWWLPVLGPIIIGYITGRKAGGPVKGAVAMVVPIVLYFLVVYFVAIGWVHIPHVMGRYFTGYFSSSVAGSSIFAYLEYTMNTGIAMGKHIESYLYYAPTAFFIMLAFAFVGGAISKQIIMERGIYRSSPAAARESAGIHNTGSVARRGDKRAVVKRSPAVQHAGVRKAASPVKPRKSPAAVSVSRAAGESERRDGKFVVHEMDIKKDVSLKEIKKGKKHGIAFL